MKNLKAYEITVISNDKSGGNEYTDGDIFNTFYLGYDREDAIHKAIDDMKHSCCTDFTDVNSCKGKDAFHFFKTEAYKVSDFDEELDEDDVAEMLGCDFVDIEEIDGECYYLKDTYQEYKEGGNFTVEEINGLDSWDAVFEYIRNK